MITIIGAGPAGCHTACLLARAGKEVQIFEEHNKIGEPAHCTGIVTSSIKNIIRIKNDLVINEVDKVKIFSPNKKFIELKLKNKNLILDRKKFDNYLADLAVKEGTKIFLGYRFMDYKDKKIRLKYESGNEVFSKTGYLIGADGPLSQVARSCNLFGKRRFMTGVQARVKLKNENSVEFYPFIGNFSWVVPENEEIVRLGVAAYDKVKEHFDNFLKLKKIDKKKIIETQGGLIPLYNPKIKTERENVFLVGDAATQIKATTGGGIIQGLIGAKCLAEAIVKNKDYNREWKKRLARELWLHLKIREILDKFKEKDWNFLINLFNKEKNKGVIEKFDRDHISKFFFRMALNEPKLLYFLKYLYK